MLADRLLLAIVAEHPDAARVVVTIDIGAGKFLEPLTMVDEPAGDGPEVGMIVLDDGHQNLRWPPRALGAKRMAALQNAPAIVAAAFDQIDLLPQILTDVAAPEVPGRGIEAHLPRLP